MWFPLFSTLLQLLTFIFLPALSVDPGAEAGGGRRPEAWPGCGGTQHGEMKRAFAMCVFFLTVLLKSMS